MKRFFLNSSIDLITKNKEYSQDQIDILIYGLESVYLTITKLVIILGIAYLINILSEVLILLVTYNIIRSQAFGIHASKSIYCLISSFITFIGGTIFCKFCVLPFELMLTISLLCNICLLLYAPADTHKRPLINAKKRKRFKYISFFLGIIYTILIIIFREYSIANYLLVGMCIAVVMILPITYAIFKMPYNNYKNYKCGV